MFLASLIFLKWGQRKGWRQQMLGECHCDTASHSLYLTPKNALQRVLVLSHFPGFFRSVEILEYLLYTNHPPTFHHN